MLILTRKPGEEILIGDDIKVTLLTILGESKTRIGIEAPPHIEILRPEAKCKFPSKSSTRANSPRY